MLCVIALGILGNPVGQRQAATKVLRALKRSHGLAEAVLGASQQVTIQDIESGQVQPTLAFKVNVWRVNRALEHIARGLYFHHFGTSWLGRVLVFPEFLLSMDPRRAAQVNANLDKARNYADSLFDKDVKHGTNKQVFYYQVRDVARTHVVRMYFYGGSKAVAFVETGEQ